MMGGTPDADLECPVPWPEFCRYHVELCLARVPNMCAQLPRHCPSEQSDLDEIRESTCEAMPRSHDMTACSPNEPKYIDVTCVDTFGTAKENA